MIKLCQMDLKGINWVQKIKLDQIILKGVCWVHNTKIRSYGLEWSQLGPQ